MPSSGINGYPEARESDWEEILPRSELSTGPTYVLSGGERLKLIKVRVSYIDDASNRETLTSDATGVVLFPPHDFATGVPTISGTPQVGHTLTASTSGIEDSDGLANATFSYQWMQRDGSGDTDIQDATRATYTLVDSDAGKAIKVKVSFTDDASNEESLTSAATALVAAHPNSLATGAPTISGTAQVGETLTASTSAIADSDGLTGVSYSYQWIRNNDTSDTDIQDETGSTYTVTPADALKTIKVRATFTDDTGNEESVLSDATAQVPAIWTGTVTVGTGPEGSGATGYSFFAGGVGAITTPRFELDAVTNTVQIVAYSQAGLHLGLSKEPFDTLHTSRRGSEFRIHRCIDTRWSQLLHLHLERPELELERRGQPPCGAPGGCCKHSCCWSPYHQRDCAGGSDAHRIDIWNLGHRWPG